MALSALSAGKDHGQNVRISAIKAQTESSWTGKMFPPGGATVMAADHVEDSAFAYFRLIALR